MNKKSSEVVILIPPSEGKQEGGEGQPLHQLPKVTKELLEKSKASDPKKLYGISGKNLDKAILANNNLTKSPTMPAIERYSGVVFTGIDYQSLSKGQKDYFDKHVKIVSAMFGLVKPQDLIPEYKLKIDKLGAAKKWLGENSKQLTNTFAIDLLPQAHTKAVSYKEGVRVDFVILKNNKRRPAGHNGKFIKGRFVRWLVQNQVTNPNRFKGFTEDGFLWDGEAFVKKL